MMPERTSFCALGLSVMAVQDVFFFFFASFVFVLFCDGTSLKRREGNA